VTAAQFPADLSYAKAFEIVRARVEEVLRPYHETEEEAKRNRKAVEESDRRRNGLIARGNEYARRESNDWDWSSRNDARSEVGKVLNREVQADWTELEVEDAVDEVLDEWDEDEEEADEDDE
jgi:hypothetical protein